MIKKRFHSSDFFFLQTYLLVLKGLIFHVSLLIDFLFMADWRLRDERTELQKRKE